MMQVEFSLVDAEFNQFVVDVTEDSVEYSQRRPHSERKRHQGGASIIYRHSEKLRQLPFRAP
jgi:hypothetical protein